MTEYSPLYAVKQFIFGVVLMSMFQCCNRVSTKVTIIPKPWLGPYCYAICLTITLCGLMELGTKIWILYNEKFSYLIDFRKFRKQRKVAKISLYLTLYHPRFCIQKRYIFLLTG